MRSYKMLMPVDQHHVVLCHFILCVFSDGGEDEIHGFHELCQTIMENASWQKHLPHRTDQLYWDNDLLLALPGFSSSLHTVLILYKPHMYSTYSTYLCCCRHCVHLLCCVYI